MKKTQIVILAVAITVSASLNIGLLLTLNQKEIAKGEFKMLQYKVEPACINHVQYYAVGDSTGLHAVTPAFNKEGKTVECNFEIGK